MQHILSLSYGKDSLACLGAIEKLDWPLDRIVHAEVWATDTIPADLPPMVEFKARADAIIKERWGIEVEHVRSDRTAETMIYHIRTRGKRAGQRNGCPMARTKGRHRDFAHFPTYKRAYIRAFDKMLEERYRRGKMLGNWRAGTTGADIFHWWMEDGIISGQISFEDGV